MAEGPASVTPLVDRQEEVGRIADALDAAERGDGRVLLFRGEAGCGKTRLAQEAVAEARRRGFMVGFGTALAESVTPYLPWREALAGVGLGHILEELPPPKLLGLYVVTDQGDVVVHEEREPGESSPAVSALRSLARGAPPAEAKVTTEGAVSILTLGPYRAILRPGGSFAVGGIVEGREDEAFLSDLQLLAQTIESSFEPPFHSGEMKEGTPASAKTVLRRLLETEKYEGIDYSREDPKARQARIFEHIRLGLSRKAQGHPVLVGVDDLHWADPSSLALLKHVARGVKKDRVLLLGTYRVEEAGARPHLRDALKEMEQDRMPAGVLLSGLPRAEMRRLVEVFLGPHALPGEFLDLLWRETQGYPLFIREVLRGLHEDGAIRVRGASNRLERPLNQLEIPLRVREAIRLRLEKLPKHERHLLDAAAACGTRFTTALLARVSGEDEIHVLRGLNNLVRVHGLLRATESGFGFDHPAVQEVAYEASAPDARRAHHRQAAEWLELVGGPVEDVAEHYYRAGEAKAVPKFREAAELARARYANAEAVRFYGEALSLEQNPGKRMEILEMLGSIYRLVGEYGAALSSFDQALSLAASTRDRARMSAEIAMTRVKTGQHETALAVCGEALSIVEGQGVAEEALILATIGNVQSMRGEYDRALDVLGRSLVIREKIGDQSGVAMSLNNIGIVHFQKDEHDRALENYNRSLEIHQKIGDQASVAMLLHNIGLVHYQRGDYDRAMEHYQKGLEIKERVGYRPGVAMSLNNIGNVHFQKGEYGPALENYHKSLEIHEKISDQASVPLLLLNIGSVHLQRGEYDTALENYRRGLDIHEKTGNRSGVASLLNAIGEVHFQRGEYDRAMEHYQKSLEIKERAGYRPGVASSLNNLGTLYLYLGDYVRANEYLGKSLTIGETIGDQARVAAVLSDLAEADLRRGDLSNAERHCQQALSVATEIGDKLAMSSAKRVLGMLHRQLERWEESAASFDGSLRILAQVGHPFLEGRTHHEFGLMWKDKAERERARDHLSKAELLFERIGSKRELQRAREALQSL